MLIVLAMNCYIFTRAPEYLGTYNSLSGMLWSPADIKTFIKAQRNMANLAMQLKLSIIIFEHFLKYRENLLGQVLRLQLRRLRTLRRRKFNSRDDRANISQQ